MAINLSLSKLPWYGQVGAFVALSLAGGGVFWHWYAVPAQADIATRAAQLETLRAEVVRGQRTARELPQFRQRVAALETQLADPALAPEERTELEYELAQARKNLTAREGGHAHCFRRHELHASSSDREPRANTARARSPAPRIDG